MVRVYSRILEETIVCVEDGQKEAEGEGRVLYTRTEVLALQKLDAEALRAVHEAKKLFGGTYIGPCPGKLA